MDVAVKNFNLVVSVMLTVSKSNVISLHMLSPQTYLGLEAEKTGPGLDGNGLGLETLWPQPHVVRPRGFVYCNVLILYSVAKIANFRLI